ncbi:Bctae1 [Apiospora phragmitis]|uniref:Alpha N-terminal protein methyltransferase 1 n=1 Tax=Apiospora phragmitis TaxID=2905665 RepID=A0ABR1W1Z7_9PEZI
MIGSNTTSSTSRIDSLVSKERSLQYWENVDASDNGMLGGVPARLGPKNSIGRVTHMLLRGLAIHTDVIEPVTKFNDKLRGNSGVRHIFNVGLEAWSPPPEGVRHDLIWIQCCVGYLTDEQLVAFLKRCGQALSPEVGVIVLKDNISTSSSDLFDATDSGLTREDGKFRQLLGIHPSWLPDHQNRPTKGVTPRFLQETSVRPDVCVKATGRCKPHN